MTSPVHEEMFQSTDRLLIILWTKRLQAHDSIWLRAILGVMLKILWRQRMASINNNDDDDEEDDDDDDDFVHRP